MSSTSRNKNLVFIIVALLLTNIAVLVYFLWLKEPEQPRQNDKSGFFVEMLKNEVGFNDQQVAEYKKLKDQQKQVNKPMYNELRQAKDSLFRLMGDSTVTDSILHRYAEVIGQQQKAIELQAFDHFIQIRALCTSPEQATKYDSAVLRMFRKMGKPPAKKDEDKKEKEVKK